MKIRQLKLSDYETLLTWWAWWRFPAPSFDMLPTATNGDFEGVMICNDEGEPLCAGFVYRTVSSIAWMEFIVSNPFNREHDRKTVIHTLIIELVFTARRYGHTHIYTSVNHPSLINHLKNAGFKKGSQTTEMIVSF